ncbi:MAG: GNAT family N-acetyltransferase [Pyrinomonadaceae bacterium]|nr:GNAT family N-acetyltransferase [Pyrinomonadaceae bacterium]
MLETERLFLRPMNKTDVDAIFALRQDAEMMRFIREPQTKLAEAASWINLVSSLWKTEKIGLCAVFDKSTDQLIGWCGLWRLKETGATEVGYAIAKDFQKKGLASEAAARCLEYGFDRLNLDEIVAVARPENLASCRVMEKIGMKFDFTGKFYERDLAHYSISKIVWQKQNRRRTENY